MTKFVKSLLAAAGVAAVMSSASASTTIDGVTFNAGTQFITTSLWEKTLTSTADKLEGVGVVSQISCSGCGGDTWSNGTNNTQLTYYFSGFAVSQWQGVSGNWYAAGTETGVGSDTFTLATKLVFTGGSVKMYTDAFTGGTRLNPGAHANTVDPAKQAQDIAAATDGKLWLEYTGKTTFDVLSGKAGTLFASIGSANSVHAGGSGFGYLDVIAGAAFGNFNTDSWNVLGTIADARFDSSYSNTNAGAWDLSGTASYKTAAIPEPASLALVGAALFGVGFAARRRKSA